MARTATKEVGIGHNSQELTDEQQQVLFFQHKAKIISLKEKIASETALLRNAYKLAKSEGFTKKDIDFAISLENDNDNEALERRRREAMIARWMGHPIGTQPDMFDDAKSSHGADRNFEEGKRAGMAGEDNASPHNLSTEAGQAWTKGWHEGQKALFKVKEIQGGTSLIKAHPDQGEEDPFGDAFED